MSSAPVPSLENSLCLLGNAMAAVMDMALYDLVLLRAQPRRHPRRRPQALFHPAHDMRTFPAALLLSAQVLEGVEPRFMELAADGACGDLLLHPHETLASIGEMMDMANAAIRSGRKDGALAEVLTGLAARALWLKHFLAHARLHVHVPAAEFASVPDPLSSRLPRRPALCSWQTDARRMDRLAGEAWQTHIANLPDPWSNLPRIMLHPLNAGRRQHGVWMPADMAAALAAMASRRDAVAGAAAGH